MTQTQLIQRCQRQSGNKTADARIGFADSLNEGQRVVSGAYDNWRELQKTGTLSLTDGTESYELASDFDRFANDYVLLTSPTDSEKIIKRIAAGRFRAFNPVTTNDSEEEPIWFYEDPNDSNNIRFYPIPNTSYTVTYDYIKEPTDMSIDSDTPFFPKKYHHILVDYALASHYESANQRDYDRSTFHSTKFRNGLAELIVYYRQRFSGMASFDYGTGVNE